MVTAGDLLPDLPLLEVDLGPIHLNRLRDTGPVVLVFFRHAYSPECDAALRAYRDSLAPALAALDAHLVAVSPQAPARLEAVKRRHDLGFFVASDPRHLLIDAFNLGFSSPGIDTALGTG
jgi:peroxiredoxin